MTEKPVTGRTRCSMRMDGEETRDAERGIESTGINTMSKERVEGPDGKTFGGF
jgi:hypothetical protein